MKNLLTLLFSFAFFQLSFSQTMTISKDSVITDTLSYSLGSLIGTNLKSQGFNELHVEDFTKGVLHAILDMGTLDLNQCSAIVDKYLADKKELTYGPVKEAGEKYLAENLKKPNIHVSKSGLQYEILTQGQGRKPGMADTVTVHYEGKLIDGTIFDSSIKRGEPIQLITNQVIAGWTEALQLMSEGSKYRLYIPYFLGYGENGAGQTIPPYATLIFDVELIKVGS